MVPTLIVDDELHHRQLLSGMLHTHFPQLELMHPCSSVEEGIEKIVQHKPSLVFLDVMLPPKTGFDLLAAIDKIDFDIIFTTSFEQYALQALKLSAVDYLLKPFGIADLRVAVEKFELKLEGQQRLQHIETLMHNVNANTLEKTKIALPTLHGYVFVQVADIIRCQADNVYTTFYFSDKSKLIVSKPIKDCEQLLQSYLFFRPHTSHLINMRFVKEYIKGDGGIIKMADGYKIDLSRMRKDEFMGLLNRL